MIVVSLVAIPIIYFLIIYLVKTQEYYSRGFDNGFLEGFQEGFQEGLMYKLQIDSTIENNYPIDSSSI